MLEKLLGAGSCVSSINHLAHHHTTLLTSLGGFSLPFVVWIIAPTFLGCWALIALASITCFQQDDRHVLLNAITHVETNISPFQMALQDV
jgi:uncharacterized membrane protein